MAPSSAGPHVQQSMLNGHRELVVAFPIFGNCDREVSYELHPMYALHTLGNVYELVLGS